MLRAGSAAADHRELLQTGADPDLADPIHRRTPLQWACKHGREACARLLLEEYGAGVDKATSALRTAALCDA